MKVKLFFVALVFAFCWVQETESTRVICYYGSWANYRNGNGKFVTEDINPHLCTHIIYTFLGIENDGNLKILDSWLEIDLKNLDRFNNLKKQNPQLKTLIAVGGWNEGSIKYSAVAADAKKRRNLINSAVAILEKYGFDGFDLDWEYPAQRGGSSSDKNNFSTLLKEFREEFNKHGYLLTAAVAAAAFSVDASYQVPALSKYLDSINVMAYDLHGAYDGATGANAPLYPSAVDLTPSAKALSVEACIKGWISRGADPQKISMGMPIYGRTFTLSNPSSNSFGALASNGGLGGPYTQESGMLGYLEICEAFKRGGWTKKWDENTKTPYAYKGNQWVGYDDERSIKLKVEFAKSLNLDGVMLWSLETEDSKGICGRKYPILNAVKEALNENSSQNEATEPQTIPLKSSTTPLPEPTPLYPSSEESNESESDESSNDSNEVLCKKSGIFRHPKDCSSFFYCVSNGVKLMPLMLSCGNGLVFDDTINACNYRNLVKC